MTTITDILELLGLLDVSPEARNVLIWPMPDTPGRPPTLVEGPLAHTRGDLTQDNALRPRLSAFLCPGATLAGVAEELTGILSGITTRTTATPMPTSGEVARALLTYGTTHVGNDFAASLRAGFRVPLPVEIDQTNGNWVTNLESLRLWRDHPTGDRSALHHEATRLPIEDPDQLRLDVAMEVGAAADIAALGPTVAARLLRNPYDAVLWVVELFRRVQQDLPPDEPRLAISITAQLVHHQASMLAWTTAGNAALRRMWAALMSPAASALPASESAALARGRRVVAEGLGLAEDAGAPGTWSSPSEVGPTSVAHELRLLPSASPHPRRPALEIATPAANESPDGQQEVVLGRVVSAGSLDRWTDAASGVVYRGPAHGGRLDVRAFIGTHRAEIGATAMDPQLEARVEVVAAIARNEGSLDAARLRDKGMVSTGLQQWTVHVNEEMTVLLEHFRGLSPDHHDLFFGLYGLMPRIWTRADAAATPVPTSAALSADNPYADPSVIADSVARPANPRSHFPRYATLMQITPGSSPQRMPVGTGNPRFTYFGGTAVSANATTFAPEWAARVRLASLCSPEYCVAQIQTAAFRFTRLARDAGNFAVANPPGAAINYPIGDLFTSQFGAALLLDAHINRPGRVRANVTQAIAATPGPAHDHGVLVDAWLVDLADRYRGIRDLQDKAQRDAFITGLRTAGTLSAAPGSFAGW